jgi:hypothetical protein
MKINEKSWGVKGPGLLKPIIFTNKYLAEKVCNVLTRAYKQGKIDRSKELRELLNDE